MTPIIPPAATPPALRTADEFVRIHENDNVELVKGLVKELPVPFPEHGMICNTAAFFLTSHVRASNLGRVMSNDSFIKTDEGPDSVRGPDVCFFSYERLPKGPMPKGLMPVSPDLVIEVLSPSDGWAKVYAKISEYLEIDVRAVVVLDPKMATASVYRGEELVQIFDNGDDFSLPDILPGFSVPVKSFFE